MNPDPSSHFNTCPVSSLLCVAEELHAFLTCKVSAGQQRSGEEGHKDTGFIMCVCLDPEVAAVIILQRRAVGETLFN